jgi:Tfp pilus assembly protein PilO
MLHRTRVRNGLIIGVLILVAMSCAAWYLVISPRMSAATDLTAQSEQVEQGTLALQSRYNHTLQDARKAPSAAADAQTLFSSMPQEADLPSVLQQITDAAAAAGIKGPALQVLTTSTPDPVTAAGSVRGTTPAAGAVNLATMRIGVTVAGSQDNLVQFLANLENLKRSLLISSTVIAPGGPDDQPSLQVTGLMFVLQSKLPDLVATVDQLLKQADTGTGAAGSP